MAPPKPRAGRGSGGGNIGVPNWLDHKQRPAWTGAATRIVALLFLAASIPALLYGWVLLFPDHQPVPLFVLAVTDYESPCPPNAFAAEDARRFQQAYADYDNFEVSSVEEPPHSSGDLRRAVEEFLAQAKPGGPDKNVVLIYLSVHGVVNDQGLPCLFMPGDDPLDAANWLPVSEVLAVLTKAERLRDCKKVVMLDASRIDDAWKMGSLANTFSIALDDQLAERRPENCIVLNASSGLESSLAAPEISGTAFGYFAANGLRGAADGAGGGERDDVVSLHELQHYLGEQVDAWAGRHRGVRQRPRIVVGGQEDVKLADVANPAELPQAAWRTPVESSIVRELYQRTAQLQQRRIAGLNPLDWARLQSLLVRLDDEALAGSAYRDSAVQSLGEVRKTLDQLDGERIYPEMEPVSLAMRERLSDVPEVASLQATWEQWSKDGKMAPPGYEPAAAFTWDRLVREQAGLDRDGLSTAVDYCQAAGSAPAVDFLEIALVRLLRQHVDWASDAVKSVGVTPKLLAARRKSEQLASPPDPRQHYAIVGPLRRLDERWSGALDDFLVGSDASIHDAEQILDGLLADGDGGYQQAKKLSDLVLRGLQTRDEALAVALPASQWRARRARYDAGYRTKDESQKLVESALALSKRLDEMMAPSEDAARTAVAAQQLAEQIDLVSLQLDEIMGSYRTRVANIQRLEDGSDTNAEVPHLLRCEFGLSDERFALRERWIKKLAAKDASPTANQRPIDGKAASTDDAEYVRWLATQGAGPLVEALQWDRYGLAASQSSEALVLPDLAADAPLREASVAIATLGGRIRERLRGVAAACDELRDRSSDALAEQPGAKARLSYSQADALSRSLAALTGGRLWTRLENDPATLLRKLDAQSLLVWQGDRIIADCWGNWSAAPGGDDCYFADAAATLAATAEQLTPASFGVNALRTRIDNWLAIMRDWQPLTAEPLHLAAGEMANVQLEFAGEATMRPGVAAVFLTSDGELLPTYKGELTEVRRTGANTGGGQKAASLPLNQTVKPENLAAFPTLFANAIFRGHCRQAPFSIGQGVAIAWKKAPPTGASVVVRGDRKQVCQLVFLVDCSSSMKEGSWDKLEDGREVLGQILDQLAAQQQKYRVCLMFYGRRSGWHDAPNNTARYRNEKEHDGPPGYDVENALTPRPLDRWVVQDIKNLLGTATPWGETPLYYALTVALGEFDAGMEGPRHLIAITDGANFVSPMPGYRFPTTSNTNVTTVLDQVNRAGKGRVEIDFVHFGSTKKSDAEGLKAIAEIARYSGGTFVQAEDAAALHDSIERSLRLDRYRLVPVGAQSPTLASTESTELGSATQLPPIEAPANYQVLLEQHQLPLATFRVEGGESLEFEFKQDPEPRLVYARFVEELRGTPFSRNAFVAAHLPKGRLDEPVFRVSVQNKNEQEFSRRPEVVWAKVRPAGGDGGRSYYFLDRDFEAEQPVPILNLRAPNWPNVDFGRIELDFAMEAKSLRPEEFSVPRTDTRTYPTHGATLKVTSQQTDEGDLRVEVNEKHPGPSEDYPLHVQLDPPPDSATRTFYEADYSARHVFHYSVQGANPKLRVLSRREIRESGVGPVVFEEVKLSAR